MTDKSFADIRADLMRQSPTVAAVLEEWMDRVEQQIAACQLAQEKDAHDDA